MKKLYFVFECSLRGGFESYIIKLATANSRFAKLFYDQNKCSYNDEDCEYSLNLAEYDVPDEPSIDGNIFRDLTILKTTETE